MSLFGTEHKIKLITSDEFCSLRSNFFQDFLPCVLMQPLVSLNDFCIYESNLNLNFNRQCISSTVIPHFSHPVKFSVLLKNVQLASLEFSSCSVYPIIFVSPCRVFISVSKQFKVEIFERYHKSHHSAMVLYGSALPHKKMFLIDLPSVS